MIFNQIDSAMPSQPLAIIFGTDSRSVFGRIGKEHTRFCLRLLLIQVKFITSLKMLGWEIFKIVMSRSIDFTCCYYLLRHGMFLHSFLYSIYCLPELGAGDSYCSIIVSVDFNCLHLRISFSWKFIKNIKFFCP